MVIFLTEYTHIESSDSEYSDLPEEVFNSPTIMSDSEVFETAEIVTIPSKAKTRFISMDVNDLQYTQPTEETLLPSSSRDIKKSCSSILPTSQHSDDRLENVADLLQNVANHIGNDVTT